MRKELLVMLCTIGLLVGGATVANASDVTWTLLQDSSIAGAGPGADDLLGTSDDTTTGQKNNCNFQGIADCDTTGSPTTGTWSFAGLELPQTASCLSGNLGDPCTTNADCGSGGVCISCPDDGTSNWDTYSYMGSLGIKLGNGTMRACQEKGLFRWTSINIGSTESISHGTGATCINLRHTPSPFSTGCGPGSSFTSTADIWFSLGCQYLRTGQIDNLALNGRVYDASTDIAAADCQCYPKTTAGAADLNAIRAVAAGKGASYLLVLCGNTSIPNDSTTTSVCLRGASVWYVVVAYTEVDASSCTDPDPLCTPSCCGPCAGGIAECGSGM